MESIQGGLNGGGNGSSRAAAKETKGRKDAGQEAVPDAAELMKSMPRLKTLLETREAAGSAYGKAVKAAAKKCGFNSDVVRAATKAYSGEKEDLELATRRAEQLSLVFEALAK